MYTLIWNLKLKNQKQHPVACHYHYSISKSPYPRMATVPSNSTKNQPRNHYPFTTNQLSPPNPNSTSSATRENALKRCSSHISATQHLNSFDYIIHLNGYSESNIEQSKRPQHPQRNSQPANTEWSYLKILYISERLNHRISNIFKKENIPIRISHKSFTLRHALSQTPKVRECTRDKCPISNTGLCLRRNVVYQLTCNSCKQQYIGSTTRFIHDRVREHLKNGNSSVKKYIYSCQNKDHESIDVKIIMNENDPADVRLYKAFFHYKAQTYTQFPGRM